MRTLVIWLVLALAAISIAKNSNQAAAQMAVAKDKAAAEAVFWQVDKALMLWGRGYTAPSQFLSFQVGLNPLANLISSQGVKIVHHHLTYKKGRIVVGNTDIHQTPLAQLRHVIEIKIKASGNPPITREEESAATDWDFWAMDYEMSRVSEIHPQRKEISQWVWPVQFMAPPWPKKPLANRVHLQKENGSWKLRELHLIAISDISGE